ncbi:transcription initiation factor TFIID subunit 2 [Blastomyces gilchristii SLH14081]|uniref:Transcription initiation factor TFIID subunit 2 n=1 Tax=Blastomyces gilchristii (strain SLH14081) TaxID=559298 RepID=A0A179UM83_BLAGS|nr:transcription initiation factor TFIID subunit 2 [Blastomyces gilchristii SLH14081]OAT08338.1 transcription initiation factor TFIID subunit 2 [Blastomyces gilchristii SLH14081]
MPGVVETPGLAGAGLGYSVVHQKVELDIDFVNQSLKGKTEITIQPHYKELKALRLNFRQGELKRLNVSGKAPTTKYADPYESFRLYGVHQHQKLSKKLEPLLKAPPEPELIVTIPKSVRIDELDPFSAEAQTQLALRASGSTDDAADGQPGSKAAETSLPRYTMLTVYAEFTINRPRDGIQFVGINSSDRRYPHVFTINAFDPISGCCLFPCVEDMSSRCTWDISIRCPRTLGDALYPKGRESQAINGTAKGWNASLRKPGISSDDESLDMVVTCSGDLTDEIMDTKDPAKKTVSFSCTSPVSAQQIGFAVGPFEYVNLSEYRESDEDDQLGRNAIPVHAFCLPGRADEVRNTCLPMAKAIDFLSLSYGSYPFSSYKMCFVDDLPSSAFATAALSICSNRVLFPEDIIDPIYESTRCLVHALASQWIGVSIIPKDPTDTWAILGISYYITDTFMKKLCGNNEYRYRLKQMSDKVCDRDISRPPISDMGALLRIDPSEIDFIALKAPLVLYILERRLSKASGKATISRIISRIFLNARMGDLPNGALTTSFFQRTCERLGHTKLDSFFQQWVYGAGCPRFLATQRFNKKKLVVEMMIRQVQSEQATVRDLEKSTFMREVKEEIKNIYAGPVQHVFTGSMTIRIHEADGTPYEHIVEIKEGVTKFDIPYNTKYKRLKRNKRQKERAAATSGMDPNAELQDDVLLYCLGDVLQSEEEIQKWKLVEWSKEDEDRMGQESYEWIRMDADFEWICKMSLTMPGYMYLSQLQQDRDIVAQLESIQYMAAQREHPLISTIFVRTLMDRRYFYGIRAAAAKALVKHAKDEVDWIGLYHLETAFQELFCLPGSPMTRSNDFSDRAAYILQLTIPQAIAQVRDNTGKTPMRVKRFLYDKLKFNDNSNNELSDCYYIAALMKSICEALLGRKETEPGSVDMDFDVEKELERQAEQQLDRDCIAEIDRYRRMDEWTTSFQNIYSRTAIECQRRFMQANVIDLDLMQFLQYTRAGTYEMLRLDAFNILIDFDIFQKPELLTWFVYVMSTDLSPWIRHNLHVAFGRGLAPIAFGERNVEQQPEPNNSLIIEQESTTEVRQANLARRQTVPGALEALKHELEGNAALKEALWAACNSPTVGLAELCDFVDICSVLYTPINEKMVVLKYPRYWKLENRGHGKLRFFKGGRFRTTLVANGGAAAPAPNGTLKRKREEGAPPPLSHKLTLKVPKLSLTSSPANSQATPPSTMPKLKLKFRPARSSMPPP